MKIEKTTCPYCGAALKIRPGTRNVSCEYCGCSVLLTDDRGGGPGVPGSQYQDQPDAPLQSQPRPQGALDPVVERQRHAFLPPPGFRSGNIVHMVVAVIGYLFLILVALQLGTPLDTVFFLLASLSALAICTGWTGLFLGLTGVKSPSLLVRIIMKTVWSITVFIAWIVILAIIEVFLP